MTWLLCDYGEVLSTAQPAEDREKLAATAGLDFDTFWPRYWQNRPRYDRGDVTALAYWATVMDAVPAADQLEQLVTLDVASWMHPNVAAVSAARDAARRGYRLAILSNAPVEVAAGVDAAEWLAEFQPRVFSCRLRMVKPEAGVFRRALEILDAPPEQIVYFDDRADNVAAATGLGIRAILFNDASQIEQLPASQ